MNVRSDLLVAAVLAVPLVFPVSAAAQVGTTATDSRRIGTLGRYDAIYGTPVFVPLEQLVGDHADPSITRGAIRTRGFLNVENRGTATSRPVISLATGPDSFTKGSIPVVPVPEIAKEFLFDADRLNLRELEMVGTFERLGEHLGQGIPKGLLFWIYEVAEPGSRAKATDARDLTIEEAVWTAQKLRGTVVRVRGQFQGKDLFGEATCKGSPADGWVIKDGSFWIWVTGRKPQGKGWSLDPTNRSDAERWVEVAGKLELRDECVVLQAIDVMVVPAPTASR
jgi:hypothetical protein